MRVLRAALRMSCPQAPLQLPTHSGWLCRAGSIHPVPPQKHKDHSDLGLHTQNLPYSVTFNSSNPQILQTPTICLMCLNFQMVLYSVEGVGGRKVYLLFKLPQTFFCRQKIPSPTGKGGPSMESELEVSWGKSCTCCAFSPRGPHLGGSAPIIC